MLNCVTSGRYAVSFSFSFVRLRAVELCLVADVAAAETDLGAFRTDVGVTGDCASPPVGFAGKTGEVGCGAEEGEGEGDGGDEAIGRAPAGRRTMSIRVYNVHTCIYVWRVHQANSMLCTQ